MNIIMLSRPRPYNLNNAPTRKPHRNDLCLGGNLGNEGDIESLLTQFRDASWTG